MRRTLRILGNAATVLSLMLCAATVAMWARSYSRADGIRQFNGRTGRGVESRHGGIVLAWYYYYNPVQAPEGWSIVSSDQLSWLAWDARNWQLPLRPDTHDRLWFWTDVQSEWDASGQPVLDARGSYVPYWTLALVAGLRPVAGGVRYLKARERRAHGKCSKCGYDLRATPDRCPECGTAAADAPRAQSGRPPLGSG